MDFSEKVRMIIDILKSNKIARELRHFEGKSWFCMSGLSEGVIIERIFFVDNFHVSDHLEQFGGVL